MSRKNDLTLLGEALRVKGGPLMDLVRKREKNPEIWDPAFERFLRGENPWQEAKKLKASSLLQPLKATAEFPMTAEFRAIDHLRITPNNERATTDLVIGFLSDNVKNNFLSDGGKIETSIFDSKLRPYRLKKDSVDGPIIADLGGENNVETTLAEMVDLMRRQGRGQKGILLTNGYANIFYIRDSKGVLWAVFCYWCSGDQYWSVYANPITDPSTWGAGDQVFSRDSGS